MEIIKNDSRDKVKVGEGKPPFFNSWRAMYWLVIINLIVLIVIFYFITLYFR